MWFSLLYQSTTFGSFDGSYQAYNLGSSICNFYKIYWKFMEAYGRLELFDLLIFTYNPFSSNYLCCCYSASRFLMWVILPFVWGRRNKSELLGKCCYNHSKTTVKKDEQMKLSHANTKLFIDLLNLINSLCEFLFPCKGVRCSGK